jgi:hypothetical protein
MPQSTKLVPSIRDSSPVSWIGAIGTSFLLWSGVSGRSPLTYFESRGGNCTTQVCAGLTPRNVVTS